LGICPSMFYTTQSTIFLRILARDLPSIAASFFYFGWVGLPSYISKNLKSSTIYACFHAREDSSTSSLRI
jgi:hypothetical protein